MYISGYTMTGQPLYTDLGDAAYASGLSEQEIKAKENRSRVTTSESGEISQNG